MVLAKFRPAAVAFILAVTALGYPARAQSASGAVLTSTCFSCHGTDGKSTGGMPAIAGKSRSYIAAKLMAFKSGKEKATIMNRIAKGFTDAEITAIAEIFSAK